MEGVEWNGLWGRCLPLVNFTNNRKNTPWGLRNVSKYQCLMIHSTNLPGGSSTFAPTTLSSNNGCVYTPDGIISVGSLYHFQRSMWCIWCNIIKYWSTRLLSTAFSHEFAITQTFSHFRMWLQGIRFYTGDNSVTSNFLSCLPCSLLSRVLI